MIDILGLAVSFELPDDARAVMEALSYLMYPICFVHSQCFCNLVDEHEVHYGKSPVEPVDLVVDDTPYSIWMVLEEWQSKRDKF